MFSTTHKGKQKTQQPFLVERNSPRRLKSRISGQQIRQFCSHWEARTKNWRFSTLCHGLHVGATRDTTGTWWGEHLRCRTSFSYPRAFYKTLHEDMLSLFWQFGKFDFVWHLVSSVRLNLTNQETDTLICSESMFTESQLTVSATARSQLRQKGNNKARLLGPCVRKIAIFDYSLQCRFHSQGFDVFQDISSLCG